MQERTREIRLGLVGAGTVGGGVLAALERNGALMGSRLGVKFSIAKVAVRNPGKKRVAGISQAKLTTNWREAVESADIDLVVELIGGTTTAREVVRRALELGRPVVTANKALLSAHGEELFTLAKRHQANLYYEASVAGGIPIIKVLREGLIGNRVTRLYGIVNGTCNYILTRMKAEGAEFGSTLADAQRLGYAEADPGLDVDGYDAAHKIGILASLAHGFWVNPRDIHVEGIRGVTKLDIQFAAQLGYTIRLLGVVKWLGPAAGRARAKSAAGNGRQSNCISVAVHPTLVPNWHVLASINDVYNAVFVRGDVVGDTLYYGRGAGQDPTASAVLSDLADAALDIKCGSKSRIPPFVPHEREGRVVPIGETTAKFYLRLSVIDSPGTLAKIAAILGQAHIGISSVIQPEGHVGDSVPLILMIHDATNQSMQGALARIAKVGVVKAPPQMIRVESFD